MVRGYNIGVRIIDDYLSRTCYGKCADFRETADQLSKVNDTFGYNSSLDFIRSTPPLDLGLFSFYLTFPC